MKPDQYEDSARRIIDQDGVMGVALLMADHTRLLEHLRAIYDEAAPRQVGVRGAETVAVTIRDLALEGLRLPADLRDRLRCSAPPAVTEGDRIEAGAPTDEEAIDPRKFVQQIIARLEEGYRWELTPEDADPLAAILQREGDAADRLGEIESRADALEEAGADLLRHLGIGKDAADGNPPPWWILAAAAANELYRLAVEKDGV